ncbi:DUF2029 domain-containing protein [Candidatus Daviesbacteria bacterium]|nr:DUF2029 domain-containing protein [Candidatus Daviesbacteria bacterium]
MERKLAIGLFLLLALIVLIFQARHPAWFTHISTDLYVYFDRATFFVKNLNLTNLKDNEHLPGAILLFISAAPALLINYSFYSYTWGFILVNLLLILAIVYLTAKFTRLENVVVLTLILLFTGPIIFFRFDLLVVFLVILSFYFFTKEKISLAAIFLSAATLVKIYPIIFLPYLMFLTIYKGWNQTLRMFLVYSFGVIFLLFAYMFVFQIPWENINYSLNFHVLKPVHTESIWATLITLYTTLTTKTYPEVIGAWGINGFAPQYWFAPLWFYNYIWVVPVGLMYLWLFLNRRKTKGSFDLRFCLIIVLLFLIFSKVLSHQYLLWYMLLVPLLDLKLLLTKIWIFNIFLILLTTFIHQYIYPLNYSQLLGDFYGQMGRSAHLFWINTLGNLILIILFISQFIEYVKKNSSDTWSNRYR